MPGPLWKITHTPRRRQRRRSFRVNATIQQLWPQLSFPHSVSLRSLWGSNLHTGAQRKKGVDCRGWYKLLDICLYYNSANYLDLCLLLHCSPNYSDISKISCIILTKGRSSGVTSKQKSNIEVQQKQQEWRQILLILLATWSSMTNFMCVKAYTSKYHDMCPILCLSLTLLYCSFQHYTKSGSWAYWHFSEDVTTLGDSALFSPHSLSLVCQNFHILLCFFVFLSSLRAHQDYIWDMRIWTEENASASTSSCINLTHLTETLNTALNVKNRRHNWLQASSQDVGMWE